MVNIIPDDVSIRLKHIFSLTCAGKADCEQKDKHFVICTNPCYPEVSEDRSDNVQAVTVTVFGCRLAFVLSDGWLVATQPSCERPISLFATGCLICQIHQWRFEVYALRNRFASAHDQRRVVAWF